MRAPLLIAAAALAVVLVVATPAPAAPAPKPATPKKRVYTKADLPKLGSLWYLKVHLGADLRECLKESQRHSLFTADQTIAFGVGLFTAAATLDPQKALKAARLTAKALKAVKGNKVPCQAEMEQTVRQLDELDKVAAELGLSPEITYQQIADIVRPLGGWTSLYVQEEADAKARCEAYNGKGNCPQFL